MVVLLYFIFMVEKVLEMELRYSRQSLWDETYVILTMIILKRPFLFESLDNT